MTESSQVSINVSFEPSRGTWMALSAAGAMMVVGVLVAVTLGIGWMGTDVSFDGQSSELGYGLSEIKSDGGSSDYDSAEGEASGTGLIATGHILAIIATVFAFLAMAVLVVSLFVRGFRLTLVGSILAALTTLMFVLTVVLAPIGISQFHDDFAQSLGAAGPQFGVGSLSFGAGLIIGIIAGVLAIGATTAAFLSLRDPIIS